MASHGQRSPVERATLDGARHGPVLGPYPPLYSAAHQARIDAARDHADATLGPDAFARARQPGAAMTYDEIVAYALAQFAALLPG